MAAEMNLNQLAISAAASRSFESFGVDPINRRNEWLSLRSGDITASVVGALFSLHPYRTIWGLWVRKCGFVLDDESESAAMKRGRLLESVAIECLREDIPEWQVEKANFYFRDPAARLGATPDVLARSPDREGFGIVQIKSVEQSVFRRKWRNDAGEVEPPLWIALQALLEAELTGASWACVAALVIGYGVDLHVVDVPLNPAVISRLRERVAEFWRCVEKREPLAVDYERDGEALLAMHPADDDSIVDLTGWNRASEISVDDAKLAGTIKDARSRRDAIKAEIIDKMGTASTAMINGRVWATAKIVTRKPYTVQASQYRDVRIKGDAT